jgi:hypothetical protein
MRRGPTMWKSIFEICELPAKPTPEFDCCSGGHFLRHTVDDANEADDSCILPSASCPFGALGGPGAFRRVRRSRRQWVLRGKRRKRHREHRSIDFTPGNGRGHESRWIDESRYRGNCRRQVRLHLELRGRRRRNLRSAERWDTPECWVRRRGITAERIQRNRSILTSRYSHVSCDGNVATHRFLVRSCHAASER